MLFEWDAAKAESNLSNLSKHRFSFESAMTIFLDPDRVIVDAIRAEDDERREKVVGRIGNRLFTVVFVMRGDVCRLISARRSNASEERRYGSHHP